MLESLTIRHVALIDDVTIRFHESMQVLTGETGAGKSIVVDSVNLLLGGRADRDMIRTGCDKASVEAEFDIHDNTSAKKMLEQENIEYDKQSVILYREISASGKNICRICGVVVPVAKMKELSAVLLDLHGQSEHQFLTDPDKQLAFLDQTGGNAHHNLLSKTEEDYERFMSNHRTYAKLIRQNENRESRMRSLEHDLEELRKAHIESGEINHLLEKRKHLAVAEKQAETLFSIQEQLSGGSETVTILQKIKGLSESLKSLSDNNDSFCTLGERCDNLYYELEDIAYQISLISERSEYEPDALEKVDNRLDLIHRLERKHSVDADELPSVLKSMEEEYLLLEGLESQIQKMASDHKKLLAEYRDTARKLSSSRQDLAADFERRMIAELNDLGMSETRFCIYFKPNESGRPLMPTCHGDDRIEFMISTNPGEPLKPLAKIASGGELSRLMLAVKTLESAHTGVDSMVFDEIDTGISGRMAQAVAEKMVMISRKKQVICVTHLPQIAAAADYHFLVRKSTHDGRTNTSVTELSREGRKEEIGRMISGADGFNKDSNMYAGRLLDSADSLKRAK